MKKSLLALAVAAALPAVAQAQSSIVLYGVADASIEYSSGQVNSSLNSTATTLTTGKSGVRVNSGGWLSSRLGMRGNEPLGNTGMSAIFNIEHRFQIDTGDTQGGQIFLLPGAANSATNNKFWNGTAWVGLATGFGEITMGRQYTPIFWAFYFPDWTLNSSYNNWAALTGNPGNFLYGMQSIIYGDVRRDNSVVWKSPAIGGLTVYAMYSFGENYSNSALSGQSVTGSGDMWGVSGVWRLGNLMVTGGYHDHTIKTYATNCTGVSTSAGAAATPAGCVPANNAAIDKSYAGSIGYNFGTFGVSAGYSRIDLTTLTGTSPNIQNYLLSAYLRLGPGRLYANVEQVNANGFASSRNGDGLQFGVSYAWELSNRTWVYAAVGKNDFSGFQPTTAVNNLDNAMRYQIGVAHRF